MDVLIWRWSIFSNMKYVIGKSDFSSLPFVGYFWILLEQSERDFNSSLSVVACFASLFTCLTAASIGRHPPARAKEVEPQIFDLMFFWHPAQHMRTFGVWLKEKSRSLKSAVYKIKSYCGSTCLCKWLFSTANIIKSVYIILMIAQECHPTLPPLKNWPIKGIT